MKQFIIARIKSFGYAFSGWATLLKSERNAWIHFIATLLVIVAGFLKHISGTEWCLLLIVTGLVWMAEAFNTALEQLCNLVNPERHPAIKQIKDICAGAVLITALVAVITGVIIFIF